MFSFTPILSVLISVIYFLKSPKDQPLARRYLVSAHGAAIAVIYVAEILVWQGGADRDALAMPFIVVCIIPLLLIVASFIWFRGRDTYIYFNLAIFSAWRQRYLLVVWRLPVTGFDRQDYRLLG